MYINRFILIFTYSISFFVWIVLIGYHSHLRRRMKNMVNTLEQVICGKEALHLFTHSFDPTASLTMQINRLMDSYSQERLTSKREENARKQLLSNLSHDVRTPLVSVIGYLEAMERGLPSENEKDSYLHTALVKAYTLKDRIDQLFQLVRLDANEFLFELKPVDIFELTRNTLIDFVPALEQQGFEVEINIPEDECIITTDDTALRRVLQNLIRNVFIHGWEGHYLGVHCYYGEDGVFIEVIDRGKGISQEDIPHIFDRLYQVDQSRTNQGGLGLTIARELSRKLGGDVFATSTKKNTIFAICLPCNLM